MKTLVAACITGYQRHISPRKGFACAHRVLHSEVSCSQFAKIAILEHGLFAALPLIRRRFAQCKSAAHILRERRLMHSMLLTAEGGESEDSNRNTLKKRLNDCSCDALSACDCAACDCGALDCGACEIGGCCSW